MPLGLELMDTLMRYVCRECGTAVEKRGGSFKSVAHLRCASCGHISKLTYSDKIALFERAAREAVRKAA